MKILDSPFLPTIFFALLVFNLTGCGPAAGPMEPIQSLAPAAGQKDIAHPGTSLPDGVSSESADDFPNSGSGDALLPLGQELEPITNRQHSTFELAGSF